MDERLKTAIEAVADSRYEENPGPATLSVTLLQQILDDAMDRPVSRNEVEVACDELAEEGRLVFLRDHGRDGRLYCSTLIPPATIELLREPPVRE